MLKKIVSCNMEIWIVKMVGLSYLGMVHGNCQTVKEIPPGNGKHIPPNGKLRWEKSWTQTWQMVGDMLVLWSLVP